MDLESSEALKAKEDDQDDTDEPERDTWSGRFDFLLSLLGYSVGLGNVWRFPYLAYNNGGGAFLVPFAIMLVLAGLPLMFMELAFGQYAALGPVAVYNQFSPLFQGLGYGMVIVSTIVMLYYNLIIAWTIWYILASATLVLPWHSCDPKWSTKCCYSYELANEPSEQNQSYYLDLLRTKTGAALHNLRPPAEEYFINHVLGLSSGIEETGSIRWEMALCLLAAWVIVFLCLCKGVHSSGKVVYFTALFPYVVLVVLFVRGVTLPGAGTGILYYLTPDWSRLANAQVWGDAAVQIFFALSPAWGGLITLSSYNKFSNNCYLDSLIVAASNICTSFFAGLVIFAVIGFLAHELNVSVDKVVDQGAGLAFIVYPEVVTRLPIAPLWSMLFFIMLLTLGLDSQFALMETVTTAILDGFPGLRSRKAWVVFGVAVFGYFGGLIFTTNSGMYWLQLMDKYAANWSVLMLAIMECILIAWVYGTDRFCNDIQLMIGKQSKLWVFFWSFMWRFTTPTALIFILVFNWVEYRPAQYGAYVYPAWADAVGWTLGLLPVLVVLLMALAQICNGPDELNIMQTARMLSQPTREWGAGDAKAMGITSTTGASGTTGTTGTTSSTAVLLMRGRATPREHQPCTLLPRGSITRRASQDSNTSHEKMGTGNHKMKRHGRKSLVQSLSQDSSDPTNEPLLKGDDNFPGVKDKCAKLQSIKMEESQNRGDVNYTKLSTISSPVRSALSHGKLESDMEEPMSILNKRRESAAKKKIDFAYSTQNDIQMTTFSKNKEREPFSEIIEDMVVSDDADAASDKAPLVNADSVIFTTAKIHLNSKNICPKPSQVVVIPIASSFENKSYDPTYQSVLSTFGPANNLVQRKPEIGVPQNSFYQNPSKISRDSIHFGEIKNKDITKGESKFGDGKIKPLTTDTNAENSVAPSAGNIKPITDFLEVESMNKAKPMSTVIDSNSIDNKSAVDPEPARATKLVDTNASNHSKAVTVPNSSAEGKSPTSAPAVAKITAKPSGTKPVVNAIPTKATNSLAAGIEDPTTTPVGNLNKTLANEPKSVTELDGYLVCTKLPVSSVLEKANPSDSDTLTAKSTRISKIDSSVTKPVKTPMINLPDLKSPTNTEPATEDIKKPDTSVGEKSFKNVTKIPVTSIKRKSSKPEHTLDDDLVGVKSTRDGKDVSKVASALTESKSSSSKKPGTTPASKQSDN